MAFLKIEYPDKDNLMKMWLPGFKKFRRIASSKQSDSFMGSDLSFEEEMRLDLLYIERWSLFADLVIMFKTPFVILLRKGSIT